MLKITVDKPIISKDAALAILDLIDKMRRNNDVGKLNRGYEDFYLRMACGIVADAGGFANREDWELALKNIPESFYSKDYDNPEYAATF